MAVSVEFGGGVVGVVTGGIVHRTYIKKKWCDQPKPNYNEVK